VRAGLAAAPAQPQDVDVGRDDPTAVAGGERGHHPGHHRRLGQPVEPDAGQRDPLTGMFIDRESLIRHESLL
jgi:hypothetical protein